MIVVLVSCRLTDSPAGPEPDDAPPADDAVLAVDPVRVGFAPELGEPVEQGPDVDRCTDGIDSDQDGKVDCEDGDCFTHPACFEVDCSDGKDSDNDGLVDLDDDDCFGVHARVLTADSRYSHYVQGTTCHGSVASTCTTVADVEGEFVRRTVSGELCHGEFTVWATRLKPGAQVEREGLVQTGCEPIELPEVSGWPIARTSAGQTWYRGTTSATDTWGSSAPTICSSSPSPYSETWPGTYWWTFVVGYADMETGPWVRLE